jgi:hypothetical protein
MMRWVKFQNTESTNKLAHNTTVDVGGKAAYGVLCRLRRNPCLQYPAWRSGSSERVCPLEPAPCVRQGEAPAQDLVRGEAGALRQLPLV